MESWREKLVCPEHRTPLQQRPDGYWCTGCSRVFPERNGAIRFFSASPETARSLASPTGQSMVRAYRKPSRLLTAARRIISSEYFPGRAWRRAKREVLAGAEPILIIGSGVTRYPNAVHLDLDDFPGVQVIGDAHRLPFADGSFGGIVCEVVLEHVTQSDQIIAETFRVLRKGGRFFFTVPFLFPYHGHPDDYRRWTRQGLAREFEAADAVEVGIHGGPCSALVNILSEWVYLMTGRVFPAGYTFWKGLATALLFPIKFLDLWVNRFPEAHRLAATFYITGRKP